MKVIIAGSRTIADAALVEAAVKLSGFQITEVVWGGAPGVDTLGKEWAERNGIPFKPFMADWDVLGKAAGPVRNGQMVEYADALIAVWDGKSEGTRDCIEKMGKAQKPAFTVIRPSQGFPSLSEAKDFSYGLPTVEKMVGEFGSLTSFLQEYPARVNMLMKLGNAIYKEAFNTAIEVVLNEMQRLDLCVQFSNGTLAVPKELHELKVKMHLALLARERPV